MSNRPQWRGPHKQRGVVAAMVVISLFAMLGIVGLGLAVVGFQPKGAGAS